MKKFRYFSFFVFFVLIIFLAFNFIIWKFYVSKVNGNVGDLARMSYYLDITFPRNQNVYLEKRHIKFSEYNNTKIDILVIGDSFSNGGGSGKNNYYQDYIATNNNKNVLNILQLKNTKNYIETITLLLNSGYLEEIGVKEVLIESVQRESLERFATEIDFNIKNDKDMYTLIKSTSDSYNVNDDDIGEISIINNLNFNAAKFNILFNINGYGKFEKYYIEKLDKDFFTSRVKDEIIFFKDDIAKLNNENEENIITMNNNFNILASKLKEKGIKLSVMLCVDKYNLYSDYIVSNTYKKSMLFETLDSLEKEYRFINTKKLLQVELKNGIKDIYYPDDTHWSYKASEIIFKRIDFDKK